jgi:hypothetical protein
MSRLPDGREVICTLALPLPDTGRSALGVAIADALEEFGYSDVVLLTDELGTDHRRSARPRGDLVSGRASKYGRRFDQLAEQWRVIENAHDREHDRDECGGVGGCSMMFTAVRIEQEMIEALEDWRRS